MPIFIPDGAPFNRVIQGIVGIITIGMGTLTIYTTVLSYSEEFPCYRFKTPCSFQNSLLFEICTLLMCLGVSREVAAVQVFPMECSDQRVNYEE